MDKVLVTAKSSKNIHRLITRTDFMAVCHSMKYNVMWITSKYGAIINGKKVTRKTFFNLMNKWGADPDKKFVMFHHSILSEGMNVSGLTACILLRNLDLITMAQTIGRVIRLHKEDALKISTGALKPNINGSGYVKPFKQDVCTSLQQCWYWYRKADFNQLLILSLPKGSTGIKKPTR